VSSVKELKCVLCEKTYAPHTIIFSCSCGGPIEVLYEYEEIKNLIYSEDFKRQDVHHWKYWPFYPIDQLNKRVSLEEGGTPLVQSRNDKHMFFKLETSNPTGSFKDRGSTIEVTKAKEFKAKEVVIASTGNMGASVAAYCARAGISCTAFIPTFASRLKVEQIKATGAKVVDVKGTYEEALAKTKLLRETKGVYLCGDYAYRGEGQKSVGFEIIDQLQFESPDYIVVPVGNATLFSAVNKAIVELKKTKLISDVPQVIGVQAQGCAPLYSAFTSKQFKQENDWHTDIIESVKHPHTLASAIACGHPVDGIKALHYLKKGGEVVTVTDAQILAARKELGSEGLYVEPSGAVSFAGAKKLGLKGKVVCVLSGHGLKGF